MALIKNFEQKGMGRNSLHKEIGATYTVFKVDDISLLQIDTYGSDDREIPGKKSQSIQLDRKGAVALYAILKKAFDFP